jgi:hypothetical protein
MGRSSWNRNTVLALKKYELLHCYHLITHHPTQLLHWSAFSLFLPVYFTARAILKAAVCRQQAASYNVNSAYTVRKRILPAAHLNLSDTRRHTTKCRLTIWGYKTIHRHNINSYPVRMKACENKIKCMLDKTVDDEPVCVRVRVCVCYEGKDITFS